MSLMYEIRRRARAAIVPVFCCCSIIYFGYHAIEGDRGLYAYTRINAEIDRTKVLLAGVTTERRTLERRVNLLRADGLDTDMLEEQSRAALGLSRADELVIYRR